ncbi:enoyl-CoA hydratase/isomerase family protein [Streptomyces sp. NPDC096311]|uniref:enoyl-CoA hydratase/isomerase family protein n=1 Tax=Streptomyces sp. NPDC096311 TaxID=3366083 RepID=UPI00381E1339
MTTPRPSAAGAPGPPGRGTGHGLAGVPLLGAEEAAGRLLSGLDDGTVAFPAPAERLAASDVLTLIDLDAGAVGRPEDGARLATALRTSERLLVGLAREPLSRAGVLVAEALTLTLSGCPQPGRAHVIVGDPLADAARLADAVQAAPLAALTLAGVLRVGEAAGPGVAQALVAESLAYSMLLAGPEFAAWRASRPARAQLAPGPEPVRLERPRSRPGLVRITLNRPERRNAVSRHVRDALVDALELVAADPLIRRVELRGAGPDFCSGGDLDEFGTADPASSHAVRLARSPARMVHRSAERVHAHLHGACVGAGIEVPSFAGTVTADPGAWFRLPELAFGLIPGAGGTVGIPRRIGRWRTAWMALTGEPVSAARALEWGLVDRIEPVTPGGPARSGGSPC